MTDWHRIFWLFLTENFRGTPYTVDTEVELTKKRQFLDAVIVKKGGGKLLSELPDGLDNISKHNLVTYKSHQETLDDWTVEELVGHYVNYRKHFSPSLNELLPAEDFRLYAVSTRYPKKLAAMVPMTQLGEGVYEILWGARKIRVIVLSRIPKATRNALWLLFSTVPEHVRFGAGNWVHSREMSALVNDLFKKYNVEGFAMPYTIEDYQKDYVLEHVHKLPPEAVLEKFPPEDRLRGLGPEDRLRGLGPEELFRALSEEDRRKLADMIRNTLPGR